MSLNSLVLCPEERVLRPLRRVLSDLEIGIEDCRDADSAVRQLTRRRFEAVTVDCFDNQTAAKVLAGVRNAPGNRHAIAVAMIDRREPARNAFDLGADFILYKPFSFERARSSFRSARALMKCESRRNSRLPIAIPVLLATERRHQLALTSDVSEGGIAVRLRASQRLAPGSTDIQFTLPGTDAFIQCRVEVAWTSMGSDTGIRFVDLSRRQREQLRSWLGQYRPETELNDEPLRCRLTDVSAAACYAQMPAPFPVGARITITMQSAVNRLSIDGVARITHPEVGMGIEFERSTDESRDQVKTFLRALRRKDPFAEFTVAPLAIEPLPSLPDSADDDPLLNLFQRHPELCTEDFHEELRKLRGSSTTAVRS